MTNKSLPFLGGFSRSKFYLTGVLLVLGLGGLVAVFSFKQSLLGKNERDNLRREDLYRVIHACYSYALDNDGRFPGSITSLPTDIGTSGLDLAAQLVPGFISAIPVDPSDGDAATTGYVLFYEAGGRLTASASGAERSPVTLTR